MVEFSCFWMSGPRLWGLGIYSSEKQNEVLHMNL